MALAVQVQNLDPSAVQAAILAWIAVALVVVAAVSAAAVKVAALWKSVADAWGILHKQGAVISDQGAQLAAHEARLNGELDARIAKAIADARIPLSALPGGAVGPGYSGLPGAAGRPAYGSGAGPHATAQEAVAP